jgi:hypothetical protein
VEATREALVKYAGTLDQIEKIERLAGFHD